MSDVNAVTVEVEYTLPGEEDGRLDQWTLTGRSPVAVKDVVLSDYVPREATVYRVAAWTGEVEDRPDGGHEAGIFDEE